MTSISKEQCIEFAQLFELNLQHWRLLTDITSSKDKSYIYSKEGIFPIQYTDEETSNLTAAEYFEIGEFCATKPLLFPCLPSELLHFIDNLVLGGFNVPEDFRKAVEQSMRGHEHSGTDSLIDWYNNELSASMWFGLQSVIPREAAMLLCRFNPNNDRSDPLEDFNPETGPDDYKRLLRVFEDESHQHTLMQWIAIARDKGLKYHSWIDEYVNVAMPAPIDGEQNTSSGTPESEALTEYRPRIGWQVALYDAWPAMRKAYGREPTAPDAIRYLKKHDDSGFILPKGGEYELWWRPLRGTSRQVAFSTVENVISNWRTKGVIPA